MVTYIYNVTRLLECKRQVKQKAKNDSFLIGEKIGFCSFIM
ncbi:hypothetical protein PMEGAPL125_20260 [Priestia megaterium]